MTEPITRTLDVPGAVLTYDVRESPSSTERPLLLIGCPMGAAGFNTLAQYFGDRTVVTYDPRGVERSTSETSESSPEIHADDLHRLITALEMAPVDLLGSSGGALNALALVAHHPEDVRTLVAHEPPSATVLPDREAALAAVDAIHETYQRSGWGPAMAKFIAVVSIKGPIPADVADQPAPDPSMFGLPSNDDGSRNDPLFARYILTAQRYEVDYDAIRAAPTDVVLAAGIESEGEMANRGAHAIAERLGMAPVRFPSGHSGFMGGEYGQQGEPEAFAAKLREVLSESAVRWEMSAA